MAYNYDGLLSMGGDQGFIDWLRTSKPGLDPMSLTSADFANLQTEFSQGSGDGLLGGINNLLGTNMTGMDALKGGLGIGQLGLGVMSYLDQSKTAKKQRGLMDQQMRQNSFLLDQAKNRQAEIGQQFGGSGLAASVK